MKIAVSDLGKMLDVALWVGGSAAATKLIELLSTHDFGAYQMVAMAAVNILAYVVKMIFSDTREEVVHDLPPA